MFFPKCSSRPLPDFFHLPTSSLHCGSSLFSFSSVPNVPNFRISSLSFYSSFYQILPQFSLPNPPLFVFPVTFCLCLISFELLQQSPSSALFFLVHAIFHVTVRIALCENTPCHFTDSGDNPGSCRKASAYLLP